MIDELTSRKIVRVKFKTLLGRVLVCPQRHNDTKQGTIRDYPPIDSPLEHHANTSTIRPPVQPAIPWTHLVLDLAGVVVDEEGVLELLRHFVELVVLVLLVELLKQRLVRGAREAGRNGIERYTGAMHAYRMLVT